MNTFQLNQLKFQLLHAKIIGKLKKKERIPRRSGAVAGDGRQRGRAHTWLCAFDGVETNGSFAGFSLSRPEI